MVNTSSRKKEREATQIAPLQVTQMIVHANKQSKDISNLQTNYGFDKCGTFEEIAHLALMRALSINATGLARVNIYVHSKEEISSFFYWGSNFRAAHYKHSGDLPASLNELNEAFSQFESTGEEVSYA